MAARSQLSPRRFLPHFCLWFGGNLTYLNFAYFLHEGDRSACLHPHHHSAILVQPEPHPAALEVSPRHSVSTMIAAVLAMGLTGGRARCCTTPSLRLARAPSTRLEVRAGLDEAAVWQWDVDELDSLVREIEAGEATLPARRLLAIALARKGDMPGAETQARAVLRTRVRTVLTMALPAVYGLYLLWLVTVR